MFPKQIKEIGESLNIWRTDTLTGDAAMEIAVNFSPPIQLMNDLIILIEDTKARVVIHVNSSMTLLFWHIGRRISNNILNNKRAEYEKQIVVTVSRELIHKFGKNYEEKNLRRMIQFADKFTDLENVVTLSRHLSWSHFIVLIPLKNEHARKFYAKLAYNSLIFFILKG